MEERDAGRVEEMEAAKAGAELEGRDWRSRPIGEPAAELETDVAAKEGGRVEVMEVAEAGAELEAEMTGRGRSRAGCCAWG